MIDLHTHILPGFDDGADDIDTALAMARIAEQDGISYIAATPHVVDGVYRSSRHEILAAADDLNHLLAANEINLRIIPGAEYRLEPDLPERLSRGELLTLNDSGRYLLVEMPLAFIPDYTDAVLYDIQLQGVTPIIAHPERSAFEENLSHLKQLVSRGVITQLTAGSLTGRFGRETEKTAWSFLTEGLVHIIASDAHSATGRKPSLSPVCQKITTKLGADLASRLTHDNPKLILDGNIVLPIEIPHPSSPLQLFRKLFKR